MASDNKKEALQNLIKQGVVLHIHKQLLQNSKNMKRLLRGGFFFEGLKNAKIIYDTGKKASTWFTTKNNESDKELSIKNSQS
jgi:hypothetical protein